jgi:3-hydroxyacyl-[acyl-carrier-protein] dehydratase
MEPNSKYTLDINQIQKFLPHRFPFLLVDRILEIHPVGEFDSPPPSAQVGTKVVGLKNVSINEPHFQGHFPGFPILPGVLMVECMAQTASFSVYPSMISKMDTGIRDHFQCILVGVDNARFRKPVVPGDTLRIETEVTKCRGKLWEFSCQITVGIQKVAEATLMAQLASVK